MAMMEEDKEGEEQKALLIKKLDEFANAIPDDVEAELEDAWDQVLADAQAMCPVDTGTLLSTIRIVKIPVGEMSSAWSKIKAIAMFDRSIVAGDITVINPKSNGPCDYASWVHDGHRMPDGSFWEGVPFLSEALAMNEDKIMAALGKALDKSGEKYSD